MTGIKVNESIDLVTRKVSMINFQSIVETKLTPTGVSGENIIYICPKCNDTSGHLYINYDSEKFHCFRCNFKGRNLFRLLKFLNISYDIDATRIYREQDSELDKIINSKESATEDQKVVDYSTDLEILTQYYYLHTTDLSQQGLAYLNARGISTDMTIKFNMREGLNRKNETLSIKDNQFIGRDYSNRIMIPSIRFDGLISYFVGRDYTGEKSSKYLNPPKELGVASEDVWNLDNVVSDYVVICEGVLTAIAASSRELISVATYGKSLSYKSSNTGVAVTSQGEKLLARNFKRYYVAYDADALVESLNTCKYLHDRGATVYLIRIDPSKYGKKADILDIGYEEFYKLLRNAIPYQGEITGLLFEN